MTEDEIQAKWNANFEAVQKAKRQLNQARRTYAVATQHLVKTAARRPRSVDHLEASTKARLARRALVEAMGTLEAAKVTFKEGVPDAVR